jgi:hypothetical protein
MAKAGKAETGQILSVQMINDNLYAERIGGHVDAPIDRDAAFDFFEAADDKQFENLNGGDYLNWEELRPGKYVFIYTGNTSWVDNSPQGQGKTVNAVRLEDRDGKEWICAAKLLIDSLGKVQQLPCMVRIIYNGKKQSKSGNKFFDMSVQVGRGSLNPGQQGEVKDLPF